MTRHDLYILDGHTPVPCDDFRVWGDWYRTADRHVGNTTIGGLQVSTVFLGSNHQWGCGPPVLFETMVFGGDDEMMDRYSTWDEAQAGHDATVAAVTALLAQAEP